MKISLFLFGFLFLNGIARASDFITRWTLTGTTTSIVFNVTTFGSVSYSWETVPAGPTGTGTITGNQVNITGLPSNSTIRLKINPLNFKRIKMYFSPNYSGLKDVEQWGTVSWLSMDSAFMQCSQLNITATDIPDLSTVTSMHSMFRGCAILNGPTNIGSWDVSNVSKLNNMFYYAGVFNQPLANWNTSNFTETGFMFSQAYLFNQPLNTWDVSNITDMSYMFVGSSFNQPLSNWNVSGVVNMNGLFGSTPFNQPINNWNTSSVQKMNAMFAGTPFNQPLNSWNTANVTDMGSMFKNDSTFNQPLSNWNTANVTDMSSMFSFANSFNQPIGNWNVINVDDMNAMFRHAVAFNQPIGSWNTMNVGNMSNMFYEASIFNQPIGNWITVSVTNMSHMFGFASSFNQPIGNWITVNVNNMSYMFSYAISFHQQIDNWNTSSVTNMQAMFAYCTSFNQAIGNWDMSNAVNLQAMFNNATLFNQSLSNWDVSNVTNLSNLFYQASSFNQPLNNWQLNNNVSLNFMLNYSGLDCSNYSTTLIGWNSNLNTPNSRTLGATGLTYGTNALLARNNLIFNKGWIINGDSSISTTCGPTLRIESTKQDVVSEFEPNVFSHQSEINIYSLNETNALVETFNLHGQLVDRQSIKLNMGLTRYFFDVKLLNDGIYISKIKLNNKQFIRKFTIVD